MSALLWLLRRSFRNWIVRKVTRLKQPRYAVSAVFLLLYLCMITAPWTLAAAGAAPAPSAGGHDSATLQILVSGFMIFSFAWTWIFGSPGALAFTMPEAMFLFPAPISRKALLAMKIVRSQLPVLVSSLFFTFATRRFAAGSRGALFATNFLVLEALFLDRLVAALARVPRATTGRPHPAALAGKGVAIVVLVAIAASFRPVSIEPSMHAILGALATWASREPAHAALAPFRAFAGPALATSREDLLRALVVPGSIVLGLLALVLFTNVAFEETAVGVSENLRNRIDQIRRTGRLSRFVGRALPAPIPLPEASGPVLALAWKNYLGITRLPLWRVAFYAAGLLLVAWHVPRHQETSFLATPLSVIACWGAFMGTFLGPDTLRSDLRVSLRGGADFLKTIPVAGWKIFLGEVLAGPLVMVVIQGFLLALAALLGVEALKGLGPETTGWAWLAAVIVLFPIDLLVFTIANGAAVLFPSWVQLGPQPERGAEAIGQNFLVGIVRYFLLFGGLVPAGIVALLVGAIGYSFFGGPALPVAAACAAGVLLVEVGGLIAYLGGALERLDPSVELG